MATDADKVRLPIKLSYGFGQFAEGAKNAAFGTFVLLYYNQVLGLSGTLAGLAIFIALCFDAVTDPVVGSVSDNFRSRWGRRHPFLYVAAIPMAFAFYFLFAPAEGLSTMALFAWMTVFTVLVRGTMTLYYVPHLALGAELTDHYIERTSIVAYRWVFSIVGNLAAVVSAFAIFLVDIDDQPGDLVAANYPPFALALAVAMAISIFVTAAGTHSQIPNLPATRFVERPGLGAILVGVFKESPSPGASTNGSTSAAPCWSAPPCTTRSRSGPSCCGCWSGSRPTTAPCSRPCWWPSASLPAPGASRCCRATR